jgi:ADP-heptose:LPS heptosyltransferase
LEGPWDIRIDIPPDTAFRSAANGRPLLCLAAKARKKERTYKRTEELKEALELAGFCVWNQDTLPVRQSLARLSVSALLLTVPSAPQWLARLVGCPVVLIPGPSAPEHLAPDAFVPRHLECQTGVFDQCSTCLDYACMDTAPGTVVEVTLAFYKTLLKPGRPSAAPPVQ